MGEDKNWFNNITSLMDENIRRIQYGVYCVAGLGIIIVLRSVRPFAKFRSPADIPSHFLNKRIPLYGKVLSLEPSASSNKNPILLVDHHPVMSLKRKTKSQGLPLQVLGVDVSSNGFSWMQCILVGSEIKFVPFKADDDRVYSIIHKNKQNVGQHLVSIGFATVSGLDFDLKNDPQYIRYYQSLLSEEKRAERKGAGIWVDSRPRWIRYLNKLRSLGPLSLW